MDNLRHEIKALHVVQRAMSQDSGCFLIEHKEWGRPLGAFTTVLDNNTKEVGVVLCVMTAITQSMMSMVIEALVVPKVREMYGADASFKVEAFTECIPSIVYQPEKPEEKIAFSIDPVHPNECQLAIDETDGCRWQHFAVKRSRGDFHQDVGILSNRYEPAAKGGPVLTSFLNLKLDVLIGKDQLPVLARELQSYTSNRFVKGQLCEKCFSHKGSILIFRGTSHLQGIPMSVYCCDSVEEIPEYSLLVM